MKTQANSHFQMWILGSRNTARWQESTELNWSVTTQSANDLWLR